jgi:hypothetical protein
VSWQWSNLEAVLDPWILVQDDPARTHVVLDAMALLALEPDQVSFRIVGRYSPLVREVEIANARVVIVYLHAEQFKTLRLLGIFDT